MIDAKSQTMLPAIIGVGAIPRLRREPWDEGRRDIRGRAVACVRICIVPRNEMAQPCFARRCAGAKPQENAMRIMARSIGTLLLIVGTGIPASAMTLTGHAAIKAASTEASRIKLVGYYHRGGYYGGGGYAGLYARSYYGIPYGYGQYYSP